MQESMKTCGSTMQEGMKTCGSTMQEGMKERQSEITSLMKQGGQALYFDPAARVLWSATSSPLELFDVSAHDAILRNLRRRGNQALVEDGRLPGD